MFYDFHPSLIVESKAPHETPLKVKATSLFHMYYTRMGVSYRANTLAY